jgi:magnesium-transporting ATPase (P-type)
MRSSVSVSGYGVKNRFNFSLFSFAVYYFYMFHSTEYHSYAQSVAFCLLVVMQLVQSFLSKSIDVSLFRTGIFGNKWMIAAFLFSFSVLLIFNFVPGKILVLNFSYRPCF